MTLPRCWRALAALTLLACTACVSVAAPSDESTWSGVERIVAIGDVHGDYGQFHKLLQQAGLIDRKNRWSGGKTHLVQLGDIPDRGADTRKIMDLMMKLERQARRAGGRVHALIGNHETMNVTGDLRYVHPGEYAAFADKRSAKKQATYYKRSVEFIKASQPEEAWPAFDTAFEEAWEARHPLGYVEHRLAWAVNGKYGKWVNSHNTVIKINSTLFVHGGIGEGYAQTPIAEINARVRNELKNPEARREDAIVNDEFGPLWYRGLALHDDDLEAEQARVETMLAAQDAKRIVVAHTPITGAVVPRFDGQVITVDVGLAAYYGGRLACLIIEGHEIFALHRGTRLALPSDDDQVEAYLWRAAELDPAPSPLLEFLEKNEEPAQ